MKALFHVIAVVYILCFISQRSSASVFSDSVLTCGGQNVTISIPETFVNDNLGFGVGDSLKVSMDTECRTETILRTLPSNETQCYLSKVGSNYEANFQMGSCDVAEKQLNGAFVYSYTLVKVTNSLIRRHTCDEITFSCFIHNTNDTVTSGHANVTDHDQAGNRDQLQQVDLRWGVGETVNNMNDLYVHKQAPTITLNAFTVFYIFFAYNTSADVWHYDGNGRLPTESSQLELGSCTLSNPADATEFVTLTDYNGCGTQEAVDIYGFQNTATSGNIVSVAYKPQAWTSAIQTQQELTCDVRLCIEDCSTAAACSKKREKRNLFNNKNTKKYTIRSVYETKSSESMDYCGEDNGGCAIDEICYNFGNQARCSKVINQ